MTPLLEAPGFADIFAGLRWQRDALCAEEPHASLDWFGEGRTSYDDQRAVCGRCLVRDECLDYAIAHDIGAGMWGGLSPVERRQEAKRRRAAAA